MQIKATQWTPCSVCMCSHVYTHGHFSPKMGFLCVTLALAVLELAL